MVRYKNNIITQLVVSILVTTLVIAYRVGYLYSAENSLRLPIVFQGASETKDRTIGFAVIERIKEFQQRGLARDSIIKYIKRDFPESEYHLQERLRRVDDIFYVQAGGEYFEIASGEIKKSDKARFDTGRRILVKIARGPDSIEERNLEVIRVASKLEKKLKRRPNVREVAEAMPSLRTSRNPTALLYKHFQEHGLDPRDYGIGRFSGKANIIIKKSFAFAGTRIFLPRQLWNRVGISAEKTPISEETKIDIVDRKNPENRLTLEHVKDKDLLRLFYAQPSGREVTADIIGIEDKTSVTLTLNPVFSDFYDAVFSIPLYPGKERLKTVTEHLRKPRFGVSSRQEGRYENFHGHLYLPHFYSTHPDRIAVYRDRESWVRFLIFEDRANSDNIVGYEWREGRIISLESDQRLEMQNSVYVDGKEIPLYYLHMASTFREFDERLDKSLEIMIATPDDADLSRVGLGTCDFSFRVKRDVSVISFEGYRANRNITRDDRTKYPIRIIRLDNKREIKISYRDPSVQGEFTVEGLNWEKGGGPVVLKGPIRHRVDKTGYFNLSTILRMIDLDLLRDIEVSDLLFETIAFLKAGEATNLKNPIRSYRIEKTPSGERFLVEDVLVDPRTFEPWDRLRLKTRRNRTSL